MCALAGGEGQDPGSAESRRGGRESRGRCGNVDLLHVLKADLCLLLLLPFLFGDHSAWFTEAFLTDPDQNYDRLLEIYMIK